LHMVWVMAYWPAYPATPLQTWETSTASTNRGNKQCKFQMLRFLDQSCRAAATDSTNTKGCCEHEPATVWWSFFVVTWDPFVSILLLCLQDHKACKVCLLETLATSNSCVWLICNPYGGVHAYGHDVCHMASSWCALLSAPDALPACEVCKRRNPKASLFNGSGVYMLHAQ
jgi:hypothetical protein